MEFGDSKRDWWVVLRFVLLAGFACKQSIQQ